MIKTVTQDNLVRFIYGEISAEEASLIQEALTSDLELKELYDQLVESKAELDKIRLQPSQKVIDNILNYSRNSAPMEHLQ
ncbi:MAG TPA: hypothetical protein PKL06_03895 [Chitinophagales bacterium]|nr:hypothetical protein [Chitinophagales bacterium]